MTDVAVETAGLGKRYGRVWALHECSVAVPAGRVAGIVGANGAGKTTLMRLLTGLSRPSTGQALVSGREPDGSAAFLRDVAYLAQEVPLYRRWTADDHLALGAHMNDRWDDGYARDRLDALDIPLDRKIEALSGGMRAQVALALALGKRPKVLLLDEPVAALDPLARREFLASLAGAVADGDVTVLMSSHLLADLERVCDHLVLVAGGTPVLCDDIEVVLAEHVRLSAPLRETASVERVHRVITSTRTAREVSLVVRLDGPLLDPGWQVDPLGLEDVVLAYLSGNPTASRPVEVVR
jgi:ABC-2 type transport system ATP-binding protein